jgi:hypothetical protein
MKLENLPDQKLFTKSNTDVASALLSSRNLVTGGSLASSDNGT